MSEVETRASVPTEAGRALDALVAEKVFGATWHPSDDIARYVCEQKGIAPPIETLSLDGTVFAWRHDEESGTASDNMPHYSTDISAAWLVVEHMNRRMAEHSSRPAGEVPLPWPDANYSTLICRGAFGVENMGGFAASFCCIWDYEDFPERPELQRGALADTAPHAIALAALSALEAP